jgi:hypothetical protein
MTTTQEVQTRADESPRDAIPVSPSVQLPLEVDTKKVRAYRGTAPYADDPADQLLFFARKTEIQQLTALTLTSPLTLLFGRSGSGKTSLVNAGLIPELRRKGCFPIRLRPGAAGDFPLDGYIVSAVSLEAKRRGYQIEQGTFKNPTLMKSDSLWCFLATSRFTNDITIVNPVLVFDQFEEIFSTQTEEQRAEFMRDIADLVHNQVPVEIVAAAEKLLSTADMIHRDPAQPEDGIDRRHTPDVLSRDQLEELETLSYRGGTVNCRALIIIREDALARLDEIKYVVPTIFTNTYRLLPLTQTQASEAITGPASQIEEFGQRAFQFAPGVVDEMVDFLMSRTPLNGDAEPTTVEPTHLQILCEALDRQRQRLGKSVIEKKDLGGQRGMDRIFRNYYRSVIRYFPKVRIGWNARRFRIALSNWLIVNFPRLAIHRLCEGGLITPDGQRNLLAGASISRSFGVERRDLTALIDMHFLHTERRFTGLFFELAHDSLVPMLIRVRAKRAITYYSCIGVTGFIALAIAISIGVDNYVQFQLQHRYSRLKQDLNARGYLNAEDGEDITYIWKHVDSDPLASVSYKFSEWTYKDLALSNMKMTQTLELTRSVLKGVSFSHDELPGANFSNTQIIGEKPSHFDDSDLTIWKIWPGTYSRGLRCSMLLFWMAWTSRTPCWSKRPSPALQ